MAFFRPNCAAEVGSELNMANSASQSSKSVTFNVRRQPGAVGVCQYIPFLDAVVSLAVVYVNIYHSYTYTYPN